MPVRPTTTKISVNKLGSSRRGTLVPAHSRMKKVLTLKIYNKNEKRISDTLGVQINVRVQISVLAGNFGKNNKRTGPNKHTGWII